MTKLTLPIEIGKRYVRRDGAVVTVQAIINGTAMAGENEAVFCATGRANCHSGPATPQDLIADHVEATAHPHAASMALYAQDAAETPEPWLRWENCNKRAGSAIWSANVDHPEWNPALEYRRKPKTIRIGEFDVPEPFRGEVRPQTTYWIAQICNAEPGGSECFNGWPMQAEKHVRSGLVHLTREAAEQHARALLSFTEQK